MIDNYYPIVITTGTDGFSTIRVALRGSDSAYDVQSYTVRSDQIVGAMRLNDRMYSIITAHATVTVVGTEAGIAKVADMAYRAMRRA